MTERLTSSSLAGTSRKLVAVGTDSDRSMFSTIRAPTPRIGSPKASGFSVTAPGGCATVAPLRGGEATGGGAATGEATIFAETTALPVGR